MKPIYQIANEIKDNWRALYADKPKQPAFILYAESYLHAMSTLKTPADKYYLDSGEEIILRFLANVSSWRGDFAKAKKAELRKALDSYYTLRETIKLEKNHAHV